MVPDTVCAEASDIVITPISPSSDTVTDSGALTMNGTSAPTPIVYTSVGSFILKALSATVAENS